jgi:hypothetical protein
VEFLLTIGCVNILFTFPLLTHDFGLYGVTINPRIGTIRNKPLSDVPLYFKSSTVNFVLNNKYKTFKKAIVVSNISSANKKELEKYFDYVYEPKHPIQNYCRDRFISYYEFLNTVREDFDYVLHVDPADVIIQNDPFLFFKEHPSKELFLVAEGMKVLENECNTIWANLYNKNIFLLIRLGKDMESCY